MLVVRLASASLIKHMAVTKALQEVFAGERFELNACPVDLQARSDVKVNAQPYGLNQTSEYAYLRMDFMRRQYDTETDVDISIESGVLEDARDIAVVVLRIGKRQLTVVSDSIPVPVWALHEALEIGLERGATVGEQIHRRFTNIPAQDWQSYLPPYMPRDHQIQQAVATGLRQMFPAV